MHNGQLADPLNKWTKDLKKVSSKRMKTDADLELMARIEWSGSLYLLGGKPVIPANVLQAALVSGAKAKKLGKTTGLAVAVLKSAELHFDGEEIWDGTPEGVTKAWESEKFMHRALVRVAQSRVARTRPKFTNWWLEIELEYDDRLLDESQVKDIITLAGRSGLCDWRPTFGRFVITQ